MSSLKGQSRVAEVSLSLSVSILEGRCSQESHTETNTIAQYWGFVSKQNQEGILLFIHFFSQQIWSILLELRVTGTYPSKKVSREFPDGPVVGTPCFHT